MVLNQVAIVGAKSGDTATQSHKDLDNVGVCVGYAYNGMQQAQHEICCLDVKCNRL